MKTGKYIRSKQSTPTYLKTSYQKYYEKTSARQRRKPGGRTTTGLEDLACKQNSYNPATITLK